MRARVSNRAAERAMEFIRKPEARRSDNRTADSGTAAGRAREATTSERRLGETRMLVLGRSGTAPVVHAKFGDLAEFLSAGDVLVVNDAATLPASLRGRHLRTGRAVEVRLAGRMAGDGSPADEARRPRWRAIVFGTGHWRTPTERRPPPPELRIGDGIELTWRQPVLGVNEGTGGMRSTVAGVSEVSSRLVEIRFEADESSVLAGIYHAGRPVQYSYLTEELAVWDQQTIFARAPVAVEPPSASFAFDWSQIARLRRAGVDIVTLTHATGLSDSGSPEINARLPFPEWSRIPEATCSAIVRAKREGRRIVAVGTGTVRALESWGQLGGRGAESAVNDGRGRAGGREVEFFTSLKVTAGFEPRIVDGLVTGMHDVGASHLDLLAAFVPRERLDRAYAEAIEQGYLWHEYGDLCLVL